MTPYMFELLKSNKTKGLSDHDALNGWNVTAQ